MTKETAPVTQADRSAAAKVRPYTHNSSLILDGERDGTDIVQAAYYGRIEAIRELEAEVERLRVALTPFADCCEYISDDEPDEEWAKFRLQIKDYRYARSALNKGGPDAV